VQNPIPELSDAFPDAVVIVDSQGKVIAANAQAASLFGYDEREITSMPVKELFPGQQLTVPRQRSGGEAQASRYLEVVGTRSDSSRFPAVVARMPVLIDDVAAAVLTIRVMADSQSAQYVLSRGLETMIWEGQDRQALLRRLIRAREEERAHIAADIHDDVIQVISAASLRAQQLGLQLRDPAARQVLGKLQETLALSIDHLRQLIFDLRPPELEEGRLGAALRAYLDDMRSDTGIAYRLDDRMTAQAPETVALLIYRNIREALTNVRKHAHAGTVTVELLDVEGGCMVRVVDDGVGYDPSEVEARPGHLGLVLIKERAELAGGWCRIESSPGAGTTVEFWVPFAESFAEPGAGRGRAG
jgi:PAS domain S-box-containing protein